MAGMLIGMAVKSITGSAIAGMVASYAVDALLSSQQSGPETFGNRLGLVKIQSSTEGSAIKKVYGTDRIAGNIIWTSGIRETTHVQETGGGKGGPSSGSHTTYTYDASFAIALCEGEITGVRRIWADNNLIYSKADDASSDDLAVSDQSGITIFTGTETQSPSPTIEAIEGAANVPAFRGIAYLLFDTLQLETYGNRIPSITCEVVSIGSTVYDLASATDYIFLNNLDSNPNFATDGAFVYGNTVNNEVKFSEIDVKATSTNLTVRNMVIDTRGNVSQINTYDVPITYSNWARALYGRSFEGDKNLFLRNVPSNPYDLLLYHEDGTLLLEYSVGSDSNSAPRSWASHGNVLWLYYPNPSNVALVKVAIDTGARQVLTLPHLSDPYILQGTDTDGWTVDENYAYLALNTSNFLDPYLQVIFRYPKNGTDFDDVVYLSNWNSRPFANQDGTIYRTDLNTSFYGLKNINYIEKTEDQVNIVDHQDLSVNLHLENSFVNHMFFANALYMVSNWLLGGGVRGLEFKVFSEMISSETIALSDIITDLCLRVGVSASEIDVTDLTAIEVKGYTRGNPSSARNVLGPLIDAYNLTAVETDYKLIFEKKHGNFDTEVLEEDLSASSRKKKQEKLTIIRSQDTELPRRVEVVFPDYAGDYQNGNQFAQRIKK